MLLPKKLIPSTEQDILYEISSDLKIPITKVKETYAIFMDYLNDIANNSEQPTINFPGLGKMYISYFKLKKSEYRKDVYNRKREIIEKRIGAKKNDHEVTVPIGVIYGVGRKNYKIGKNPVDTYDYFTKKEIIRKQNFKFFEEDREFSDRKDIYTNYFTGVEPQKPRIYEFKKYSKSKAERQE